MIVTIEQIQTAVLRFIDMEIMPKASDIGQFAIGFAKGSIPVKVANMINQFKATGMVDDIFDESGNIKLDEAYKRAKDSMTRVGKVSIL